MKILFVGKADYDGVLDHGLDIFKRKFMYFVENILGMDELFEVSFSPLAATGKALSRYGVLNIILEFWNIVNIAALTLLLV